MKINQSKERSPVSVEIEKKASEGIGENRLPFLKTVNRAKLKIIAFNVVNAILIVLTIVILNRLPLESEKIKELRSQSIQAQGASDVEVLKSEIEKNSEQINALRSIFVNDENFVDFISKIDSLKADGTIVEFVFPVSNPVVDKDKNLGFPVNLVLKGSEEAVNNSLTSVLSLHYILKPINLEISISDENEVLLKYAGFLIVDESLNSN